MAWTIWDLGGGGGDRKMNIFGTMKKLWMSLDRTNLGAHFYTFYGFFLKARYRMGILGGHKISNIYLGTPDIPDIFIG